jgi:hypothetical protein
MSSYDLIGGKGDRDRRDAGDEASNDTLWSLRAAEEQSALHPPPTVTVADTTLMAERRGSAAAAFVADLRAQVRDLERRDTAAANRIADLEGTHIELHELAQAADAECAAQDEALRSVR